MAILFSKKRKITSLQYGGTVPVFASFKADPLTYETPKSLELLAKYKSKQKQEPDKELVRKIVTPEFTVGNGNSNDNYWLDQMNQIDAEYIRDVIGKFGDNPEIMQKLAVEMNQLTARKKTFDNEAAKNKLALDEASKKVFDNGAAHKNENFYHNGNFLVEIRRTVEGKPATNDEGKILPPEYAYITPEAYKNKDQIKLGEAGKELLQNAKTGALEDYDPSTMSLNVLSVGEVLQKMKKDIDPFWVSGYNMQNSSIDFINTFNSYKNPTELLKDLRQQLSDLKLTERGKSVTIDDYVGQVAGPESVTAIKKYTENQYNYKNNSYQLQAATQVMHTLAQTSPYMQELLRFVWQNPSVKTSQDAINAVNAVLSNLATTQIVDAQTIGDAVKMSVEDKTDKKDGGSGSGDSGGTVKIGVVTMGYLGMYGQENLESVSKGQVKNIKANKVSNSFSQLNDGKERETYIPVSQYTFLDPSRNMFTETGVKITNNAAIENINAAIVRKDQSQYLAYLPTIVGPNGSVEKILTSEDDDKKRQRVADQVNKYYNHFTSEQKVEKFQELLGKEYNLNNNSKIEFTPMYLVYITGYNKNANDHQMFSQYGEKYFISSDAKNNTEQEDAAFLRNLVTNKAAPSLGSLDLARATVTDIAGSARVWIPAHNLTASASADRTTYTTKDILTFVTGSHFANVPNSVSTTLPEFINSSSKNVDLNQAARNAYILNAIKGN